ncbi:hypothetical protein LTR86_007394 [Recurvomyces mirabilis]|nr:hypothetical protein LTR86_007394 [Recurvomyces mirabilis]
MSDSVARRQSELVGVYIGMVVPATAFVAVRLAFRQWLMKGALGSDDWAIVIAIVLTWIHTGLGLAWVANGFGKHAVDIPKQDLHKALMYWYIFQIIYNFVVGFTKLSIALLYLRIFGDGNRWFRPTAIGTSIVIVVGAVAFAIPSIIECHPIHRTWDRTLPGTCFPLLPYWYAHAVFNVLCDVWLIVLPLPVIKQLQMRTWQKVGLGATFGVGGFVIFTAIMRIINLAESAASTEPTWGSVSAFIWAELEGGVGIICACLPTLRAPAARVLRRTVGLVTADGSKLGSGLQPGRLESRETMKRRAKGTDAVDSVGESNGYAQLDPRPVGTRWSVGTRRARTGSEEQIMGVERKVEIHMLEEYGVR